MPEKRQTGECLHQHRRYDDEANTSHMGVVIARKARGLDLGKQGVLNHLNRPHDTGHSQSGCEMKKQDQCHDLPTTLVEGFISRFA